MNRGLPRLLVVAVGVVIAMSAWLWWPRQSSAPEPRPKVPTVGEVQSDAGTSVRAGGGASAPSESVSILEPDPVVFAQYAGSASCRDCHTNAFAKWAASHHGLAERKPSRALDDQAFEPPRVFHHGTQTTAVRSRDGFHELETLGLSGKVEAHRVERVLGHDPLRQYLVAAPGGRWQTMEASWDPRSNAWFNVYGAEDRKPGEWGHWTGRGMNWNSMCGTCHNTRFRKNYDEPGDSYRSAMAEMGVGCESCHGPMKEHVRWQQAWEGSGRKDPTVVKWPAARHMETCAPCHARRTELTGDVIAGASFWDHYHLAIADDREVFYADGQIREEDYEFTSFLGSRMHAAGVTCLDCHDPHAGKPKLEGNALCMQCHNGSRTGSPVIDPAKHTFHKVDGAGSSCVNCHMPQTPYMQRHWRHDHGFTTPDPRLTREAGIPNACNRCHTDRTADWASEACDRWYGVRMERPARQRTRLLLAAGRSEPTAIDSLVARLETPETPYWKAVIVAWLQPALEVPGVRAEVARLTAHEHPLVRYRAVQALARVLEAGDPGMAAVVRKCLTDPARAVRFAAAMALRRELEAGSLAGRELRHALELNADQPLGQAQWAGYEWARGQGEAAASRLGRAVSWDAGSAGLRQDYATLLSALGRAREALDQVREAVRLEPKVAENQYRLGLAWNEVGDLAQTKAALEEAVRLDPRHDRALYNLGLACAGLQRWDDALRWLQQAETVSPTDPRIPYARATIYAQTTRPDQARAALERALALQPGFAPARELLQQLAR